MQNHIATFFLVILILSTPSSQASDHLTEQLKYLVNINSGSNNSKGVKKVQDWVQKELKKIGFEIQNTEKNVVVAVRKGESDRNIIILAHADTVFEPSSPFQKFVISDDKKTATGPGVIDDKGGLIVAIEGLRRFLKDHQSKYTMTFISSPGEEIGSPGLTTDYRELANKAWMVLSFEPALENGSIIESRKGNRWYKIKVTGKESHAGRAHKEGINACVELSSRLVALSQLTNYKAETTVSVGHIEGGQDKFNIVCGEATAKVDTRFVSFIEQEKLHKNITRVLSQSSVKGSKIEYELVDDCPPMIASDTSKKYIKKYSGLINSIERANIASGQSGGAGDINYMSRPDLIMIDGLGPVGGKMHTAEEFIYLSSLDTRAEAFYKFLQEIGTEQ